MTQSAPLSSKLNRVSLMAQCAECMNWLRGVLHPGQYVTSVTIHILMCCIWIVMISMISYLITACKLGRTYILAYVYYLGPTWWHCCTVPKLVYEFSRRRLADRYNFRPLTFFIKVHRVNLVTFSFWVLKNKYSWNSSWSNEASRLLYW
jgi:hypothetical protein